MLDEIERLNLIDLIVEHQGKSENENIGSTVSEN